MTISYTNNCFRKTIKLAISDVENEINNPGFLSPILGRLSQHFPITLTNFEDADYLFYGDFGVKHLNFKGIKIFFTGENHKADWHHCDYAFTHDLYLTERHMRIPFYSHILWEDEQSILKLNNRTVITKDDLKANPRKFCNFVYRNHAGKTRNRFFDLLSKYKKVDSAGALNNNMNGYLLPKGYQNNRSFASQYKFTISFENEEQEGYTTEKITHPLIGRSIPIYWGNKLIFEDFNEEAFLNYFSYNDEYELIEKIIEIDNNDDLLLKMLNSPCLNKSYSPYLEWDKYLKRFKTIFRQKEPLRTLLDRNIALLDSYLGRNAIKKWQYFRRRLNH